MAIARRVGYGKKILVGDKNLKNAEGTAEIMKNAGFDAEPVRMDLSSRTSIDSMIKKGRSTGKSNTSSMLPACRRTRHPQNHPEG